MDRVFVHSPCMPGLRSHCHLQPKKSSLFTHEKQLPRALAIVKEFFFFFFPFDSQIRDYKEQRRRTIMPIRNPKMISHSLLPWNRLHANLLFLNILSFIDYVSINHHTSYKLSNLDVGNFIEKEHTKEVSILGLLGWLNLGLAQWIIHLWAWHTMVRVNGLAGCGSIFWGLLL